MTSAPYAPTRTRIDPEASDDELVLATRAGNSRAYGVLWDRHSPAALRAARSITSSIDPEDLVSEAFAKTFSAIRNGGGPTDAFRPYIFAAVRSAAATWGGKQKDLALEYIDELPDDDSEDSLDLLSDKALLTAAFKDLPERWRTLLWYLEVEGMKPREIAPLMGLSPNAVSVLATRAREGFKTAWLNAHIKEPGREAECRWTCERIVAQGRKRHVARADRVRFEAHLEGCRRCTMASAEVAQASSKLRAVLLPAILGGPAAAAYSAASPAPAMAVVAGLMSRGAAPWAVVGGAVVAVTVAAAAVAVAVQQAPVGGPGAEEAPISALIVESPAPISTPVAHDAPVVPPAPVPLPTAEPTLEPVAEPAPAPVAETSVVVPELPQEIVPPSTPTGPRFQPHAPPPTTPVDEEPVALPVTISWPIAPTSILPPPITGTGVAGAEVVVVDDLGRTVATTVVDATGHFSVTADADAVRQGMTVVARHTSPIDGTQTESDPIGPLVFALPGLAEDSDGFVRRTDEDGDGQPDDLHLVVRGLSDTTVALSFDGGDAVNVAVADGSTVVVLFDIRPGLHRITLRYVDPLTGAVGPTESEHIIVVP